MSEEIQSGAPPPEDTLATDEEQVGRRAAGVLIPVGGVDLPMRQSETRSSGTGLISRHGARTFAFERVNPSQLAQEIDHGGINLCRALLLRPVTTAWEHNCAAQLRNKLSQVCDELIHAAKTDDKIPISRHVE